VCCQHHKPGADSAGPATGMAGLLIFVIHGGITELLAKSGRPVSCAVGSIPAFGYRYLKPAREPRAPPPWRQRRPPANRGFQAQCRRSVLSDRARAACSHLFSHLSHRDLSGWLAVVPKTELAKCDEIWPNQPTLAAKCHQIKGGILVPRRLPRIYLGTMQAFYSASEGTLSSAVQCC
jgi:hypothetical protein